MIRKIINFPNDLYGQIAQESKRRGLTFSGMVRQIIFEYFFPKPISQISTIDPQKISQLLDLQQRQMEKLKELEVIKRRLDILVDEPEGDTQKILDFCLTPKSIFEIARNTGVDPSKLVLILRYLVKMKKVVEKDGKYKRI